MRLNSLHKDTEPALIGSASILIVDDDRSVCEFCRHVLNGYQVFIANSCEEALRLYQKESCELMLTDVVMPGESGIDLLNQIKTLDPNAVVIVMTGYSDKNITLNALKEGADDFIEKPLDILQLKSAIEKALTRKRLKEELASLKRLDSLKNNFLSLVSHKLRTPITSISLFMQNLQHDVYDPESAAFKENLKLVMSEIEYLGYLVSDLLSFNGLIDAREGMSVESCDLNDLIRAVIEKLPSGQSIKITFNEAPLPKMLLDREKISFVIQQIIENAYKFSGKTGSIKVITKSVNGSASIEVVDNGIGIAHEELAKVFGKFYQGDPYNSGQIRGFGLGLFYAKELVNLHGGSIRIDSELGVGSTVTIKLPLVV